MGEKQDRRRKYIYLFFACIIITPVLLSGCFRFYEELITRTDFEQAADWTSQENFQEAANKYEQIAALHPRVGDEVHFQMGMIYVSPQNQNKDYKKAMECFQRVVSNYPESRYRRDSELLISLINEISTRDNKVNTQRRQIDSLEQKIEEIEKKLVLMKEVDMNLKQKKKTFP